MSSRGAARLVSRLVAPLLALGAALGPVEAAACLDLGDYCDLAEGWTLVLVLNDSDVPTDGMLLFELVGYGEPAVSLADFELEVTLDGVVVPGAFETIGFERGIAWRPAQAFAPNSLYQTSGSIHNSTPDERCVPESVPMSLEFTTGPGPMPPLVAPTVTITEELLPPDLQSLDDAVCCDDALPYVEVAPCGAGTDIVYDEGFCAPKAWTGQLYVTQEVRVGPGPGASMLAARLVVDGQPEAEQYIFGDIKTLTTERSEPFCSEVVVRNLATGESLTTPKQCHGDAVAGQLGKQVLTPDSPLLAGRCAGAPYTCEPSHQQWDPQQCAPWPGEGATTTGDTPTGGGTSGASSGTGMTGESGPGESALVDHGCTCNAPAPAPTSWLGGMLVLAMSRRRRR